MMQIEIGTPDRTGTRREPATASAAPPSPAPAAIPVQGLPVQLVRRREPAPIR